MKIEFIDKNYKTTKKLKEIIEAKLSRLDKYFGEDASARVVSSKQGKIEKLEVNIKNKGLLYRGEVASDNMYANIDLAMPKIERQIVRQHQKVKDKLKRGVKPEKYEFIQEKPKPLAEVYKKKSFEIVPMLVEDAKDAMARLDHDFFIFLNAEDGKVNVLYKRKDEKFGLIEVKF